VKRPWRRSARREVAELNITAFMNLMVVLVPFLLVMAVFSRMTILELNLPAGASGKQQSPSRTVEVIVRKDHLYLQSNVGGQVDRIGEGRLPNTRDGYDLNRLSELLRQVKARWPDVTAASLLLEPDIEYDALVQVMDTVRITTVLRDGKRIKAELFPEIAIGDAPRMRTASAR
jgi:biopolymer transport protein ExbD